MIRALLTLPILLIYASLGASPMAAASLELARTHEHHLGQSQDRRMTVKLPDSGVSAPARRQRGSNVLFTDQNLNWRDLPLDKDLSKACRRGQFLQRRDLHFIVRLEGGVYGAAPGGHSGLLDPGGLAQPGFLYIMRNQSNSRCQVRVMAWEPD